MFKFDPETAHNIAEFFISKGATLPFVQDLLVRNFVYSDSILSQQLWGVHFPNPVGIGAGFDKNATMIEGLSALGFGYLELGTVTPRAQIGNPKPRLFRFPKKSTIQNAMGFNNDGSKVVSRRVDDQYPYAIPIGINIGKNKTTPEESAIEDYKMLAQTFKDLCDYITINISSPNTPGLRDLQNEAFISSLIGELKKITPKPILLKIAPDMSLDDALGLCDIAVSSGFDGIIATNTTVDYSLLDEAKNFGGLSGEVLREKSFTLFCGIAKEFHKKTKLISVGGICCGDEAYERILNGASLVQIYTQFIFKGPSLIREVNETIARRLREDGFGNISEAIGSKL
jgi:dihydroorotate dehydrogenase